MKRKLAAIFMTLALLLSVFPFTAFAEEAAQETQATEETTQETQTEETRPIEIKETISIYTSIHKSIFQCQFLFPHFLNFLQRKLGGR